jgi:hypothetical protein
MMMRALFFVGARAVLDDEKELQTHGKAGGGLL